MAWVQQKKVPIYGKLQDIQKQTYVTLKNIGSNSLKLDRFKNWSGKPLGDSFPDTLPPEGGAEFTHLRGRHGSVAAVQYSGLNMSGKTMAITVAWKASSNYRPPNVPNRFNGLGVMMVLLMSWVKTLAATLPFSNNMVLIPDAAFSPDVTL